MPKFILRAWGQNPTNMVLLGVLPFIVKYKLQIFDWITWTNICKFIITNINLTEPYIIPFCIFKIVIKIIKIVNFSRIIPNRSILLSIQEKKWSFIKYIKSCNFLDFQINSITYIVKWINQRVYKIVSATQPGLRLILPVLSYDVSVHNIARRQYKTKYFVCHSMLNVC